MNNRNKRNPRRRAGDKQYADMTGRRVLVPGSYFLLSDDGPYPGLVRKWTKYKNDNEMLKLIDEYDP